uniref:ORF31 n=1 Tax=Borreliella burgdorferi TaxID=139 RepID=Q9L9M5_BORBG|nr:ORF31 [Borreliella burgdorferi]
MIINNISTKSRTTSIDSRFGSFLPISSIISETILKNRSEYFSPIFSNIFLAFLSCTYNQTSYFGNFYTFLLYAYLSEHL